MGSDQLDIFNKFGMQQRFPVPEHSDVAKHSSVPTVHYTLESLDCHIPYSSFSYLVTGTERTAEIAGVGDLNVCDHGIAEHFGLLVVIRVESSEKIGGVIHYSLLPQPLLDLLSPVIFIWFLLVKISSEIPLN